MGIPEIEAHNNGKTFGGLPVYEATAEGTRRFLELMRREDVMADETKVADVEPKQKVDAEERLKTRLSVLKAEQAQVERAYQQLGVRRIALSGAISELEGLLTPPAA